MSQQLANIKKEQLHYTREDDSEIVIVGAVRLMDGLFIGDAICAEDIEFLKCNKITHILNCAGSQIENVFMKEGFIYLNLNWEELKPIEFKQELINEITNFVGQTLDNFEGILIHSLYGKSRSFVAALIFLMNRFRWGLIKTLEYLNAKKPGFEMTASLLKNLMEYEQNVEISLKSNGLSPLSHDWETFYIGDSKLQEEEKLIVNSYKNSLKFDSDNFNQFVPQKKTKKQKNISITWARKRNIFYRHKFEDDNKDERTETWRDFEDEELIQDKLGNNQLNKNTQRIPLVLQNEKFETITKIDLNDIQDRRLEDEDDDMTPLNLDEVPQQKLQFNYKSESTVQDSNPLQNVKSNQDNIINNQSRNNQTQMQQSNYKQLVDVINKKEKEQKSHFDITFQHSTAQHQTLDTQSNSDNVPQMEYTLEKDLDEKTIADSPKIKNKQKHKSDHKGPYMNPTRASQEQIIRFSQHLKGNQKDKSQDGEKEEQIPVSEIKNHQYFKKKKGIVQFNDTFENLDSEDGLLNTAANIGTERYNPLKIIRKDLIKMNESKIDEDQFNNESDDEEMRQTHSKNRVFEKNSTYIEQQGKKTVQIDMIPTTFYRLDELDNSYSKESNKNVLDQMKTTLKKDPQLRPDELISRERAVNQISQKVDSMKNQVNQMKFSHIEQLKQQADLRRINFYNASALNQNNNNIANQFKDFNQNIRVPLSNANLEIVIPNNKNQFNGNLSPQEIDKISAKSDHVYIQSIQPQSFQKSRIVLPLIPKAQEFLDNNAIKNQPLQPQINQIFHAHKQSSSTSIHSQLNTSIGGGQNNVPEPTLQAEEKIKLQQQIRMQTRLQLVENTEAIRKQYFNNRVSSLNQHKNQVINNGNNNLNALNNNTATAQQVYFQSVPFYNIKANDYTGNASHINNTSALNEHEIIDRYINNNNNNNGQGGRNKVHQFHTHNPSSPANNVDKLNNLNSYSTYGLDGLNSLSQHLDRNSSVLQKDDFINKYKVKVVNKLQQTTQAVLAGTMERRKIL